jgi:hypothetical protein
MATIRVHAEENKALHQCKERSPPVRNGAYVEFQDATEEELAFWDVLDDKEKRGVIMEAYRRCFYDALHEYMQSEAEKGKRLEEKENLNLGQPKPEGRLTRPPAPSGPNQPPIL